LINTNHKSKQLQQKFITQQINKPNAYSFFNLLTSPNCYQLSKNSYTAEAAIQTDIKSREISFKHSLQLWLMWTRQTQDHNDMQILFTLIAQQKIGNRPGRTEPRAVKRRLKPFSLLMIPRDKLKAGDEIWP